MHLKATEPYNEKAVATADEEIYRQHEGDKRPNPLYDKDGNRKPLDLCNTSHGDLREEWMRIYKREGGEVIEEKGRICPTCEPVAGCPECKKTPQIKAKKNSYVVVLDKTGNPPPNYPILEFEITNGCPNHYIDIQVAKVNSGLLSGGPGLANSWDRTKSPKDRISQQSFSSWSNGETTLCLDGKGKATYKMPLEWWQDLARQPRNTFTTMKIYYRVITFSDPSPASTNDSSVSSVEVHNNLTDFKVVDLGYVNGGVAKSIRMEFTVREANTTEMYTFVQWMQGSFRRWSGKGPPIYPSHKLYGLTHISNFPDFTIDRLRTNPRYWDGNYNISADKKTASATDAPSQGSIVAPFTHYYSQIDFETRVHLNFKVPAAVRIIRKEGSPPTYGIITGDLAPPEPITLDSTTWKTRVLQVRDAIGVTTTHPNTFTGP